MKQLELFRTSVLAKLQGMLVLISIDPFSKGPGKCPVCNGLNFHEAPYGWIECECGDFAVLKAHLEQIESQLL